MQTLLAEKFRYLLDAIEYDQSLFPGNWDKSYIHIRLFDV